MTNRREFLQTGASVSALSLGNGLLAPDVLARLQTNGIRPHKAIFDDRYAQARLIGATLGMSGVRVHALLNGDATALWHRERTSLRHGHRVAIAGITQYGPMFVFEQLAREQGMRIALRVEHTARADGTIGHVMSGPQDVLLLAEQLQQQGVGWPAIMAALLTHCRADEGLLHDCTVVTAGTKPELIQDRDLPANSAPHSVIHYYTPQAIGEGREIPWDGALYSWLIAPVERLPDQATSART